MRRYTDFYALDVSIKLPIDADDVSLRIQGAVLLVGGCSAWAKSIGISKSYAHDLLHGRRKPGPKVLIALGLERVETEKQHYREIAK